MPTRRTHRRCFSILGALHEVGDCTGLDLCKLLRCGSGTIYPELVILENDGLVAAYWVDQGLDLPRRRFYRVTTADERKDFRRRRRARTVELKPVPRRRSLLWGTGWQPGDAA